MKQNHTGWTLLEILVVLAIIGTLALIGIPNILKHKTTAEVEQVIAKARLLDTSKVSYLGTGQRRAIETAWGAMTEDERYVALKPFLTMPPDDLSSFTPSGYTIVIGGLYAKTTITRVADGASIDYQ